MEIQIPASIRKDQITTTGGLKGCVASKLVVLDGQTCQAGSVMFVGFRGALNVKTKMYEGVFAFTSDVADGAPTTDLNALFVTKPAAKKVKATDGNNDQ